MYNVYHTMYDTEIQELDSNMQYLVYENHSKFIKASETIREVSHNVFIHGDSICVHLLFPFFPPFLP